MESDMKTSSQKVACDGNIAAAYGTMLCRPDVISLVPITPQHGMVTQIYQFHTQGLVDAEMVEAEGEQSAMSIVNAASACGGRTFTATSQAGLYFMWDAFKATPNLRLPVVMAIVSREDCPPSIVVHSQQDVVSTKDQGWIIIFPETCQEVLDTIIMAYRLAEDTDILIPVTVAIDGFYLSHLTEIVAVPAREDVDRFLAPLGEMNRTTLTPKPVSICGAGFVGRDLVQCRYEYCESMENAKEKIAEIDTAFEKVFGRSYGGLIEEYRTEDADVILVTMGSVTGTARLAIDIKREAGIKAGLIKLRVLRPLPREKLAQVLKGKKAVGVIDRNICFGCNAGNVFMDLKTVLYDLDTRPQMTNFIDGIGGLDISVDHVIKAIDITHQASLGKVVPEVSWLGLE
ncbi:transketolase C-terminal domain-containing protein [Thermodesulfobacteriota bacterium]